VNERLETTAEGVWAMGDCAGSPHFTHVAFDDYRIVRDNWRGAARSTRGRLIPFCMFTDPELARVGLNENEASHSGRAYRRVRIDIGQVLRTRTLSETRGFLKALISADGDEILGFTALGPQAGEIVAVVQTAMLAKMPYIALRDCFHASHYGRRAGHAVFPRCRRVPWQAPRKGGVYVAGWHQRNRHHSQPSVG